MVPITGRARSFLLVFKNKIERRGRQNKNNRPINLPNDITFSTDLSTPPNPNHYHTQYIYVTRSEKTYHFAQKLKKRYKQKSRKKSFFNPKLFLAYLKFQLLGFQLAKFQHLKRYIFAKRAAQRELLLFSSRGRLYVNGI